MNTAYYFKTALEKKTCNTTKYLGQRKPEGRKQGGEIN